MLKYLLLWNNGHIIYDVVSFCMEFEDESKYCVKRGTYSSKLFPYCG